MKIKKLKYFEKKPVMSLSSISYRYSILVKLEFRHVGFFVEGGKQKKPVKHPQNKVTTTSTHIRTQARIEHGPHQWEASTLVIMNLLLVTR